MFDSLVIDTIKKDFSIKNKYTLPIEYSGVHIYAGDISGFNVKGANFSNIDIYNSGKKVSSSFVGGTLSAEMRRAGYSDIYISNSQELLGVEINDDSVVFVDGNILVNVPIHIQSDILMGKGCYITTGMAADKKSYLATIIVDGNDYQLRNGSGKQLNDAGIKYITVRGTRLYDQITAISEKIIGKPIDLSDNILLGKYHIERYGLLMVSKLIYDKCLLEFNLPEVTDDFTRSGCNCSGEMYHFFNSQKQELPCYDSFIVLNNAGFSFDMITDATHSFKDGGLDGYLASVFIAANSVDPDQVIGLSNKFISHQLIEGFDDERYTLNDSSKQYKMYDRLYKSSRKLGIDPYFATACSVSTYENVYGLICEVIHNF